MFRIYLHSTNGDEWLSLEGTLAGQCVYDLERCWLALTRSHRSGSLLLDMTRLQSADQNGRRLLRQMRSRGVTLAAMPFKRRHRLIDSCRRLLGLDERSGNQENILDREDLL